MADSSGVSHLRVALTTREYASLVEFFTEGLGVQVAESWTHDGGRGVLMDMGAGSLEVFDEKYAGYVDEVETGQVIEGAIRLALQVPDVAEAVERLLQHGGKLVHGPVSTPWGDLNARVETPDGLQVTLFEAP